MEVIPVKKLILLCIFFIGHHLIAMDAPEVIKTLAVKRAGIQKTSQISSVNGAVQKLQKFVSNFSLVRSNQPDNATSITFDEVNEFELNGISGMMPLSQLPLVNHAIWHKILEIPYVCKLVNYVAENLTNESQITELPVFLQSYIRNEIEKPFGWQLCSKKTLPGRLLGWTCNNKLNVLDRGKMRVIDIATQICDYEFSLPAALFMFQSHISPNGKKEIGYGKDGLRCIDFETGQEKPVTILCNPVFAWSPDSNLIADFEGSSLHIFDLEKEQYIKTITLKKIIKAVEWAPDGKSLAIGFSDDNIHIIDLEGKELKKESLPPALQSFNITSLHWNDKRFLKVRLVKVGYVAAISCDKLFDLEKDIWVGSSFESIAVSPNGNHRIASTPEFFTITNNLTDKINNKIFTRNSCFHGVQWSPNSSNIAIVLCEENNPNKIELLNLQGEVIKSFISEKKITDIQWSRDSKHLAVSFRDAGIKIFTRASFREILEKRKNN